MEFQAIRFEQADGVVTVTLNRPERLNAIDEAMRRDLRALTDACYADDAIRVVVVTGAGQAFCAGADIELFERDWDTPAFRAQSRVLVNFFNDLEALEKPVLAAINGTCVGGGLELALACDLRIAAASARFGFPEARIGLIPGVGGCSRLVKLIGYGRAKELVLTGELIPAEEARAIGLVNRVVPDGELMTATRTVAAKLLERAPQALGLAKRVIRECVSADLAAGRTLESLAQSLLLKTRDHREGIRAFRAKRPPRFEGR